MIYALTAYLAIAGPALLISAALVLSAWDNRRFTRRRLSRTVPDGPWPKTAVFVPCRGLDPKLEENLRPLFEQRYSDYELVFILESEHDPACCVIQGLIQQDPQISSRLVFSGAAVECGQKVHSLRVATKDLPSDVEVLAFVDSDARPHPEWLSRLVDRVRKPEIGAATGYRCFVPANNSLANLLLASINANVTGLMGPHWHNRVWGGSWAIRRKVFEKIQLRKNWQGTLSDDLVASRLLHQSGMKVAFEPHCLLASPLDMSLAQMLEFMRRQFVVGRFYARQLWLTVLLVSTLGVAAFWGGGVLAVWWLVTGEPLAWIPLVGSGVLYGSWAIRGWLRQNSVLAYFPKEASDLRGPARFDLYAAPLIALVNWCGLVSSLVGRRIVWRGIRYRLSTGGQVRIEATQSGPHHMPEFPEAWHADRPKEENRRRVPAHHRPRNQKPVGKAHPT